MTPPIRLDNCPLPKLMQNQPYQRQTRLTNRIGASAGLSHSAAIQISMIASGNHTVMFITPPYSL